MSDQAMAEQDTRSLDLALSHLREGRVGASYYAVTLLGENGKMIWGMQSRWSGFTETEPRQELRVPRRVTSKFAELWSSVGQPYVFAHKPEEMMLFMMAGGNGLVEQSLFESAMPDYLEPAAYVPDGPVGFAAPDMFPGTAFKRAPSPKLRMQVLNRDARRCRICGRRPDDNVDVQLHVHHIRPWAKGGVTDPKNLITLCHTCHDGLAPHFDPSLFEYTENKALTPGVRAELKKFIDGVAEYRRIAKSHEITD